MASRDDDEEGLLENSTFFPSFGSFHFFKLFLQCYGALLLSPVGKCFECFYFC